MVGLNHTQKKKCETITLLNFEALKASARMICLWKYLPNELSNLRRPHFLPPCIQICAMEIGRVRFISSLYYAHVDVFFEGNYTDPIFRRMEPP